MSTSTTAVQDRPYQATSRDLCFGRWQSGDCSTLLVLPTGTGKTVVAGLIAQEALEVHGRRTLFIAHREELIHQAEDKLGRLGLTTAIEMGTSRARSGFFARPDVVIATVQTLQGPRLKGWDPREFGLIVVDEAHHVRAKSYRTMLDHFRDYWLLGITATPDRGDRKNLGVVFPSLAFEYSLRSAIAEGYLVPIVAARLMTDVDLRNIRTTGGDYSDAELAARIAPCVEQLADAIGREVGGRQTVVFCPDVRSSEAMADVLTRKGVPAAAVSGAMPKLDRRATLQQFHNREFQAIVCCDLLTEGWDEPQVACIAICRPTRLRNRYAQMIGRGTRPHPDSGKADCLVLDFAWETTSPHELCTTVDLFDDSHVDDEALALAGEIMGRAAPGEVVDPLDALDRAERELGERRRLKLRLTGCKAVYRKYVYDPVGVGALVGITIKKGWDDNPMNPATDKQLDYLRKLGVAHPEGLSRQGAGKLIDNLAGRREAGLATVKQVAFLNNLGVDPEAARTMEFQAASEAIAFLLNQKASVPRARTAQ